MIPDMSGKLGPQNKKDGILHHPLHSEIELQ
jgi:hypothetical protein